MLLNGTRYPSIYAVSAFVHGKEYGLIVMTSNPMQIRSLVKQQLSYLDENLQDEDICLGAQQLLLKEGTCRII